MDIGDQGEMVDLTVTSTPRSPQEEVEAQADKWGGEWAEGEDIPIPAFPEGMEQPPMPLFDALYECIRSFPPNTTLGCDAYNPRLLLRLSPQLLHALLILFHMCEKLGKWPGQIALALIPLLPKNTGGLRPIGILATFVRVWMRMRAPLIKQWECDHQRTYFYAGKQKGANVASWLQASLLENASLTKLQAAASFVDLVN